MSCGHYNNYSRLEPGLEKTHSEEKSQAEKRGKHEEDESKREYSLLLDGSHDEETGKVNARHDLENEGKIQEKHQKQLRVVQKILKVPEEIEKKHKQREKEEENDRSSRKAGHPQEKGICSHGRYIINISR
jgi:hypothetical protein